jgi:predicted nucleic acid-binding protein
MTTDIAISAARACIDHKLSTADAIIYATAQAHGAELLTCDANFESLPKVQFIPKA